VGIVEAGKLVAQGSLKEMQRRVTPHRTLQIVLLDHAAEAAQSVIFGREHVLDLRVTDMPGDRTVIEVDFTGDDAAVSAFLKELVARGLSIVRFAETMHDVEDVFMKVTQGIVS
jgi:ABC-type multidrug transport system ATPase subunit